MKRLLLILALAVPAAFAQPLAFVDRYQSTLASGYTSGGGSLSVSSASGLPSGATYFFAIVRADGGNTEEVFLVTNVSGTTLTVTGAKAGTSASNHGAGATIVASVMAKDAFTQMETDVQSVSIANAASTGTTVNKLAKLTGAPSTAVITATSDTGGAIGIVVAGAGTSGSALVQFAGTASCVYDGATTAGDYVQFSSTTAGDCHDAGSTYPTSGQTIGRVLSTNGGGGTYSTLLFPPESKPGTTATSPALVLVEQHTANNTSSNLDFTTCISSTYDDYQFELVNIVLATNGANLLIRASVSGTFDTGSNYAWSNAAILGSLGAANSTSDTSIQVFRNFKNTTAAFNAGGTVKLYGPGSTSLNKIFVVDTTYSQDTTNSQIIRWAGSGSYLSTSAVDGIRFLASSGNITSGTIRCYGVAK